MRVENTLTDENGEKVRLKKGAEVEVTIELNREPRCHRRDENNIPQKFADRWSF